MKSILHHNHEMVDRARGTITRRKWLTAALLNLLVEDYTNYFHHDVGYQSACGRDGLLWLTVMLALTGTQLLALSWRTAYELVRGTLVADVNKIEGGYSVYRSLCFQVVKVTGQ
jgi:hypothetical protein